MESKNLGLMIAAFIMIVIGASLIGVIADQEQAKTKGTGITSEAHDMTLPVVGAVNTTAPYVITNYPSGWKVEDCPITSFVIKNQSGGNQLTLTTDYTFNQSNGTYFLKNTTATIQYIGKYNKTYVDYVYCGNEYMNSSWGRTVLDLAPGFFALAIMGIGVALFFGVLKNEGLLGI